MDQRVDSSEHIETEDLSPEQVIEIWSKVVDVQKHFNEICMRIRAIAATSLTALIGVYAYLVTSKSENGIQFFTKETALVSALALVIMFSFWVMDRNWYHQLLRGAVDHGEFIEGKYAHIPELGLATAISQAVNGLFLVCA